MAYHRHDHYHYSGKDEANGCLGLIIIVVIVISLLKGC